MENGVFLSDTSYSSKKEGKSMIPVDIFNLRIKNNGKHRRMFRYMFKIGKQPIYTPNWKLKEIIKNGNGSNNLK